MIVKLTRSASFSAAHRYHQPLFTAERNQEIFGPCNNPYGHGHDYRLEVTVTGPVDPMTGMIINLADLDKAIATVVAPLDHQHLNHAVDYFQTHIPTTENIAQFLYQKIKKELSSHSVQMVMLRLFEGAHLYITIEEDHEVS